MTKNYFILTFTTILSCFICQLSFASNVLGSGTCGENAEAGTKCEWKVVDLGGGKKELQIYGSGPMDDYHAAYNQSPSTTDIPWRNYQSSITSISISGDITSIGGNAFVNASNCTEIDLSKTNQLTHIGYNPFQFSGIQDITIPSTVQTTGHPLFADMTKLKNVTFQGDIPDVSGYLFWNYTPKNVKVYYNSEIENAENKIKEAINKNCENNYCRGYNPPLIACIPHADGSKDLFDAQGKLLKRIDESGNLVQTYAYNEKGQLISILDPDGNKIESYKYDFGGNLIAVYKNGERVFAKRIYTVPEAIAATHQNKNTFSIIYR